jgi:hypothetical protein
MSHNNKIYMERVKDKAYGFNDLILKRGGSMRCNCCKHGGRMCKHGGRIYKRGGYSLKPVKDALMSSPLAMKVGGIVDGRLYKDIQNIGFGNKTYIPTI